MTPTPTEMCKKCPVPHPLCKESSKPPTGSSGYTIGEETAENRKWFERGVLQERKRLREEVGKKVLYVRPAALHSELSHQERLAIGDDEVEIWLGDTADGVWGDDWNDAPDEHNSGTPYPETVKGLVKIKVKLNAPLTTLDRQEVDVTK